MAKLSKSTRTIIIAAAVLLVLGVVLVILMLTAPSDKKGTSDGQTTEATIEASEDTSFVITDKEGTEVLKAEITNAYGSYTFDRHSRLVTSTDEEGVVTTTDEYYWVSEQLKGAPSNDTTIKAFMNCLAGLKAAELVEAAAEDLDKYGLESPVSTATVTFDDNTKKTVHFGITNPSATSYVYCREDGSNDVYMASYYSTSKAYSPITDFVSLSITESYNTTEPAELDYFIIERKGLAEPIEISYMYDVQEEAEKEDSIVTTFNSHRITSPIVAEVDYTIGQTACYGLYGMSASYCVSVAPDEDMLTEAGMDDPHCKLTFKYGGNRYVVKFGNEIINITESEDGTPDLKTVVGYYGMVEGSDVLYAFAVDSTPWYTLSLEELVSRRPVSPYIYTCDAVVVTTPDREYNFIIEGDAEVGSTFSLDGTELDNEKFRELYQHLISSIGEELYRVEGDYEPYVTVEFKYRDEYHEVYGTASDKIEFYQSDDRKNIIRVNGEVLFKVRQVFTDRLIQNIDALLNGGELELNW